MSKVTHLKENLPVAVFDFDHTLTHNDSFFPFLRMIVSPLQFWWGLLSLSPILGGYALGLLPNWQAKEAVLTFYLGGLTNYQLQQLGQRFAVQKISKLLRPEAVERLRWHQKLGHKTILVSASLEAYLVPWAKIMGFDKVIGTKLEIQSDLLTGRILGKNCYGQEKVEQLRTFLGDLSNYCIYAYGDSRGDKELLAAADYPYYRKFQDTVEAGSTEAIPHWERGLILSVVTAAAIYLGMVLWSGADQFWVALKLLPPLLIPGLLVVVFTGYCLRFARWQLYLQLMGYQVPIGTSFRIFLASFALTASPGKAGESIKSLLLKRRYNIPIAPTLAGLFCERFTDALSVVLLICLSLFSMAEAKWIIIPIGLMQLAIILALQNPIFIKRRLLKPLSKLPKLQTTVEKIETVINTASILLKPKILVGGTLLPLLGWGLEGIALYLIFQFLSVNSISLYQAVLIHTTSGLIGVLSLLPGGIGTNELFTVGLSRLYGAPETAAVIATFLIRLLTLWFAVGTGILAMLSLQNKK
ncbi:HAD-IB family hydrolase [Calothrix rhizosoleniae]|uniref:HAD-IB family hydrolase n=1 Tax=Calothrix rhizosoleniae TaxID=888997 RepID=UPI000B49DC91|nr:HAD-IB family hydrolase [Calothrix rhizosoleniae]